jgi:hypothetical protein
MDWISINDKKPSDYDDVWVCNNQTYTGPFRAIYIQNNFVLRQEENDNSFPLAVTHWIKLPEIPGKHGL